ncbi:hypothetical protein CerSpe_203290 [Prunus speciosa]
MSPVKMKQLIFEQLKDAQAVVAQKEHNASQVLTWRGNHVMQQRNCIEKFNWRLVEVPFDKSILLWHIATDLCYYSDLEKHTEQVVELYDAHSSDAPFHVAEGNRVN